MKTDTTNNAHPFELSGMGRGPYDFIGTFDLGEAMNPDSAANFGNMTGKLKGAPELKAGMGTCACCGHGITIICIVRDGNDEQWGVGSDCVMKTGQPALCDAARVAVAKRRKMKAAERREKKRAQDHAAWLAKVDPETGETNTQRQQRERQEWNAELDWQKAMRDQRAEKFADVIKWCNSTSNAFFISLAIQLGNGPLSPRQAWCLAKGMIGGKGAMKAREDFAAELQA